MDYRGRLAEAQPAELYGSVVETTGLMATVADLPAPVGAVIELGAPNGVEAEVVGFRGRLTIASPIGGLAGVRRGQRARLVRTSRRLPVGADLLGRVVDANCRPIDGLPQPEIEQTRPIDSPPTPALNRPPIREPLPTGVRAIDTMLTCGRGQRLGVFAGSGVGKSTLLGMMCRNTAADVIVIGLVGERGREVNEFLQHDLGDAGRARSVTVVATSDEPAVPRLRAASTATAIAEFFRDQGKDVMLLVDSLTRTALASREVGLAAGEPPTTRGFPPSTFAMLPKIVERAGQSERGSITAFYSVLVEGDDPDDPIADCLRGLLDGHIWLSRAIAARGHYPSIDVANSVSRLMPKVSSDDHQLGAQSVRRMLAALAENEDLISIGAYRRGANPTVDAAIELRPEIDALLQQGVDDEVDFAEGVAQLTRLAQRAQAATNRPRPGAQQPNTTPPQRARA